MKKHTLKDYDTFISEAKSIGSKPLCTNVLCFGKMLKKQGFITKSDAFHVRVILKGDGNIDDRKFDIEVDDVTDLAKYNKEFKKYDWDTDNVSTIGWNLNDEDSETREIFYADVEEVIQDLNLHP